MDIQNETSPFTGDALNRKIFAHRLEKVFPTLGRNNVVCVDGEWGSGKSWLTQEWIAERDLDGCKSVRIDASATDHVEDPFLPIASALIAKVKEGSPKAALTQKVVGVAKGLIPSLSKFFVKSAGKVLTGDAEALFEISEEVMDAVSDKASATLSEALSEKLKDLELESKNVKDLKEALGTIFNSKDFQEDKGPLVIFIDELDRCRPDYAIKFLERIKLLFGVEGVVFVLMLDVAQLKEAIKGIYGTGFDASKYLNKFINLFFILNATGSGEIYREWKYRQAVSLYLRYVRTGEWEALLNSDAEMASWLSHYGVGLRDFCAFSEYFSLSQREMESVMGYLAAAGYSYQLKMSLYFLPLVIKVKNYELYNEIISDEEGHGMKLSLYMKKIRRNHRLTNFGTQEKTIFEWYMQAAEAYDNGGEKDNFVDESNSTWIDNCGWQLLHFMDETYVPESRPNKEDFGAEEDAELGRAYVSEVKNYTDDAVKKMATHVLRYVNGSNPYNFDLYSEQDNEDEDAFIKRVESHIPLWRKSLHRKIGDGSYLGKLFLDAEELSR